MATRASDAGDSGESRHASDADYAGLKKNWANEKAKRDHRIRTLIGTNGLQTIVIALLVGVVVYLAVFRVPTPYVVEIGPDGSATFGGYLTKGVTVEDKNIPPALTNFVERWRTVTPDRVQQKRYGLRLYCMFGDGTPSRGRMNEYYQSDGNDPFDRGEYETVAVDIRQISKLDGSTWQVEWYETVRAHDGRTQGDRTRWRATMIVEPGEVVPECLEGNPLGIYVPELNWTQVR